jgi:hypothetical protein
MTVVGTSQIQILGSLLYIALFCPKARRCANNPLGWGKEVIGQRLQIVVPAHWDRPGLDERRIADLLGQKTPSKARLYSRPATLAEKNRERVATLEKENERRAKIVKPSPKSVKPDQSEDRR